jgi:hypothetical protein
VLLNNLVQALAQRDQALSHAALFAINNLCNYPGVTARLVDCGVGTSLKTQNECLRPKQSFNAYTLMEQRTEKQIELIKELYWCFSYLTLSKPSLESLLSQYPNLVVHLCQDFID